MDVSGHALTLPSLILVYGCFWSCLNLTSGDPRIWMFPYNPCRCSDPLESTSNKSDVLPEVSKSTISTDNESTRTLHARILLNLDALRTLATPFDIPSKTVNAACTWRNDPTTDCVFLSIRWLYHPELWPGPPDLLSTAIHTMTRVKGLMAKLIGLYLADCLNYSLEDFQSAF